MGWEALHDAMRSQGITSREDLSEWIHNQGFPRPRWCAHFSGRAQERILNFTVSQDARGSAIEALYVHIVLHRCRSVHHVPINPEPQRGVQCPQRQETNWEVLDRFDLHEVFEMRFRVLQSCPRHLRGRFQHASRCALEARHQAVREGDRTMEVRAWKLFCLLPFWLLQRPQGQVRVGKAELCDRFDKFGDGQWSTLNEAACQQASKSDPKRQDRPEPNLEERAHAALQKIQQGEVSRARQCLTGAALATGTEATFLEMQSKQPQIASREIPQAVLDFEPEEPVTLDRKILLSSLKSSPRGSSPGPGGCTYEHL